MALVIRLLEADVSYLMKFLVFFSDFSVTVLYFSLMTDKNYVNSVMQKCLETKKWQCFFQLGQVTKRF